MASSRKITASFGLDASSAKQELDALRQAEEQFTAAGGTLATSLSNGFKDVESSVQKSFNTLNAGGAVSEAALTKLISKLAAMKEAIEASGKPLEEMPAEFRQAFETGQQQVAALSAAMETAKARTEAMRDTFRQTTPAVKDTADAVRDVGKAAEESSSDTAAAFEKIRGEAASFEDTAAGAISKVEAAWQSFNQEQKLTQAQINDVGQAVESLRIVMAQQAETGVQASQEQIQVLSRLEGEYSELTARANQLSNATKDNAINLKETGTQVNAVAGGVQVLAGLMGPLGKQVGSVAGEVGNLASTAQQLKGTLGALDVATLGAGKSAAALGVQVGAVAATAVLAVTAGLKLAGANEKNKEVIDDLLPSLADLRKAWADVLLMFGTVADRMGAVQGEVNKLATGDGSIDALRVAAEGGADALHKFHEAVAQGIPEGNAAAGAIALANSELREKRKQLLDSVGAENAATESTRANAEQHRTAAGEVRSHTTALDEYATAQQKANDAVSAAGVAVTVLEQAHAGTTAAISQGAAVISSYIQESDKNSVALGQLATALQTALDSTDGLTKAERGRIQALIDLAKNANGLTDAEQKRAAALAQAIISGKAATEALNEQGEAAKKAAEAIAEAGTVTGEAATATDSYTDAIRRHIEAIDDKLRAMGQSQTAGEALSAIDLDAGTSADYLRMKRESLARELEGSLSVWRSATEATNTQKDAQAELAAIIEREKTAQTGIATAAQQLYVVHSSNRDVFTNLTEAQNRAATATIKVYEATQTQIERAREAAEVIRELREETDKLTTSMNNAATAADKVNQ